MNLSIDERNALYRRQASFTRRIRFHAYRTIGLANMGRVLDVGSGTGVVAREIRERCGAQVFAVDIEKDFLSTAPFLERIDHVAGDAAALPFASGSFDAALCHFFIMWARDPLMAVSEMKRVVRSGGWVVALAEPDYGGWMEYPDKMDLGCLMAERLALEGADPETGRKLRAVFKDAGLDAEVGLSANVWDSQMLEAEFEEEWNWRFRILGRTDELEEARADEKKAVREGKRFVFLPIFHAFAKKV